MSKWNAAIWAVLICVLAIIFKKEISHMIFRLEEVNVLGVSVKVSPSEKVKIEAELKDMAETVELSKNELHQMHETLNQYVQESNGGAVVLDQEKVRKEILRPQNDIELELNDLSDKLMRHRIGEH